MAEFDWSKYESSAPAFDWSRYEQEAPASQSTGIPAKQRLLDLVKKAIRGAGKKSLAEAGQFMGGGFGRAVGEAGIPIAEQLPIGIKEGLQRSYAGLTGGEFKESTVPDEFGSGFGRGLGQLLGQTAVVAPLATAGGIVGGPWGAIAAGSLGTGATTPGSLADRGIATLEAAALPIGAKAIGKGIGMLKGITGKFSNLKALQGEGALAQDQHAAAIANQKEIDALAKRQGFEPQVDKLEHKLLAHKQNSEALSKNIANIPVKSPGEAPVLQGQNLVPQANKLLQTSEQHVQEAEKAIKEHLGEGLTHDVRAAKKLNEIIKAKKSDIGAMYESIKDTMKDQNIILPRGREVKQITDDIQKAVKEGGYGSQEVEQLAKELEQAQKGRDIVPAEDFLAMYRSTRRLANKARRNSIKEDIDAKDRQHWQKQHQSLNDSADSMLSVLKNHLSDETFDNLMRANARWKNEITPLYDNKLYWKATKEGRLPFDIIQELRGTGKGQAELRDMIKKDPELLKNVVGQRYAHQPQKLHQFDELSEEYIQQMPELKALMKNHKEALRTQQLNKDNVDIAKIKAKEHEEAFKAQSKEFESIQKSQQKRAYLQERQAKINDKIAQLNKLIPQLKEARAQKGMTLQNKLATESKLKAAEKEVAALKNTLKKIAIFGAGAISGTAITGKALKGLL